MKIFAISDMHGNLDGLDPSGCDVVVVAGDFSKLSGGGKWHLYDQKKWIQTKFFNWTDQYPDIKFVVVPGNHDMCLDPSKIAAIHDVDLRISWPDNVSLLIDSSVTVGDKVFYGSPWVPIISYRWAFEAEHDDLIKVFSRIPDRVDVLITHAPPHIGPTSGIDRPLQRGGHEAFGSHELASAIAERRPRFSLCGHIHSGAHDATQFCGTVIRNVSRVDENYEIAYEPAVFEI